MSAESMKAKGEKTRAKILGKLGKRPKHPEAIASALKLNEAYVQRVLQKFVKDGKAEVAKEGRAKHYKLPAQLGA